MAALDNVTSYIAAGFARLDYHLLDSAGLPAGATGTVTPGGIGVPAGRLLGVKTAAISIPAPANTPVTGDNALLGTFQFPSAEVRAFEMQVAANDLSAAAAFQQQNAVNLGNLTIGGFDTVPFGLANVTLLGVSNAQAQTNAALGLGMYANVIIPRCQVYPTGRINYSEREAGAFRYNVTMNPTNAYPWGVTFSNSVESFQRATVLDATAAYPLTIHRFNTTATSTTVFTLAETPISTSLNDVIVYAIATNGTATRYTANVTVNTTLRTLTFDVSQVNNDIVVLYQYQPA